jgi:F-type H+-transporting ATPase subunit a
MNKTTRGFVVFGILVLVVAFLCVGPAFFWLPAAGRGVPLPVIALPGEVIAKINGFGLTNTVTSLVLVDFIVVAIALTAIRALSGKKPEEYIPRGFMNGLDLVVEFFYDQTKPLLGERTNWVFPVAMSIFLFLLVANWIKLIPGVESVGVMACAEVGQPGYGLSGYQDGTPGTVLNVNGMTLSQRAGHKVTEEDVKACEAKTPDLTAPAAEGETQDKVTLTAAQQSAPHEQDQYYTVVPYFRALATDLNMPLALAIIVVVLVQVWGVRALGPAYFFKFINIPALGDLQNKPLGAIDFVVGLVEIISEISRIISLSFRLFGNIFAGGVLLIVMTFLVAGILPSVFYFLEIFVGLIQAYVFSILTVIYASQAVVSHHDEEHEAEHEAHGHDVPVAHAQLP